MNGHRLPLFELVDVVRDERGISHHNAPAFLAALRRRLPEVDIEELLLAALEALSDDVELRNAYDQIDVLEDALRDRLSTAEVLP